MCDVSWGAQGDWYETPAGHDMHARRAFDLGAQTTWRERETSSSGPSAASDETREARGAKRSLAMCQWKGTQHENAEREKVESVSAKQKFDLQANIAAISKAVTVIGESAGEASCADQCSVLGPQLCHGACGAPGRHTSGVLVLSFG